MASRRGNTNHPKNPWFTGVKKTPRDGGKVHLEYYYLGERWTGESRYVGCKNPPKEGNR